MNLKLNEMIKANELRIGNWYDCFGLKNQASWSTIKELENAPESQLWCKPTPLTEEWLIKLGFTRLPNQLTWGLTGRYFVVKSYDGFNINVGLDKIPLLTKSIKYVHQLQNIFFALTEKELEIK